MENEVNQLKQQVRNQAQLNQEVIKIKRKRNKVKYDQIIVKEKVRKQRKIEDCLEKLQINEKETCQQNINQQSEENQEQNEVKHIRYKIFRRIENYVDNLKDKMNENCIQKFEKLSLAAKDFRNQKFNEKRKNQQANQVESALNENIIYNNQPLEEIGTVQENPEFLEQFPNLKNLIEAENKPQYEYYRLVKVIDQVQKQEEENKEELKNEDEDLSEADSQDSNKESFYQNSYPDSDSEAQQSEKSSEDESIEIQEQDRDENGQVLEVEMEEANEVQQNTNTSKIQKFLQKYKSKEYSSCESGSESPYYDKFDQEDYI